MRLKWAKGNDYGQRWSVLEVFNIPDPSGRLVYLKRLRLVQTPWFGIYVHWINLPDDDRDPHDHPWNFTSIVLRGGYTEALHTDRDHSSLHERGRWSAHRMTTGLAHQIIRLEPRTVTLILTGRRSREWGFWTETGWVDWHDYDRAGLGPDPFMGEVGAMHVSDHEDDCPECRAGKHVNCTGTTLNMVTDEWVECGCQAGGHA